MNSILGNTHVFNYITKPNNFYLLIIYKMSYRSEYIFLLSIFLGIIVISTIIEIYNGSYLPYIKTNIFQNYQHIYEGYSSLIPNDVINSSQSLNTQANGMNPSKSTLLSAPYNETQKIDVFSNTAGSLTCAGSGYSNSGGALCLTPEQINLLKTRGGNSTGGDSQIGSK